MKELIEKQAVIDALLAKMDTIDDKPKVVLGLAVAAGMIKDMPSALEQEPCDAVSREAVIEGLASIAKVKAKSDAQKAMMGRCMYFVEKLPSVTPAEKVGHWIPCTVGSGMDNWECSVCGRRTRGKLENLPYCCCGAKMEEVEE